MISARALLVATFALASCSEVAGVRSLRMLATDVEAGAPVDAAVVVDAGGCGDTESDRDNCGACGHSCRGGACTLGECGPSVVAAVPDTGAVVIAADGERIFVGLVDGQLLAAPASGGALASIALVPSQKEIAVDSLDLFVATDTSVLRCPAKSCALPQKVASAVSGPSDVATLDGDVYFLAPASLLRAPRTGGASVPALAPRPVAYVVDADAITFTRADGVYRCPTGGCEAGTPPRLASATAAGALTLQGGDALWIDGTTLRKIAIAGASAGAQDLATVGAGAGSLVAGDARVYWREQGTRVAACPRSGGPAKTLASGDDAPVSDLASDTTSIYWVSTARNLMRLAR